MVINFKIKKDKHFSSNWLYKIFNVFYKCIFIKKKIIEYDITFKNNCLYKSNNDDINKLFGFSIGTNHMENSIRFGWRSNGKAIKIFAFYHINGQFQYRKVCDVQTNTEYKYICSINKKEDYYYYKLDVYLGDENIGYYKSYNFRLENKIKFSYNLYPYFGGNLTAPNEIDIIFKS